jgi:hypothetical protein
MKVKGFVSTTIGTLMHAGMESFDTAKFPDPDAYLEDKAKDFASFIGLLYGYSKMNDTDEVTFNVDGENISITVKDFKENIFSKFHPVLSASEEDIKTCYKSTVASVRKLMG